MQLEELKKSKKNFLIAISLLSLFAITLVVMQSVRERREYRQEIWNKQQTIEQLRDTATQYADSAQVYQVRYDSLREVAAVQTRAIMQLKQLINEQNEKLKKDISGVMYLDADSTYQLFTERTIGR